MSSAVTKTVDIGGQPYTLTAKFGTMRLAEPELGATIPNMMADIGNVGFDAISALFWAFLQPKHRMTREGSDNLVDEAGVDTVTIWVGECMIEYFGTADAVEVDEGNVPTKKKKVGIAS